MTSVTFKFFIRPTECVEETLKIREKSIQFDLGYFRRHLSEKNQEILDPFLSPTNLDAIYIYSKCATVELIVKKQS